MKDDILMFHRLMRAMPLDRPMSVADICREVANDGGPAVEEWDACVRRVLLIDENVYFDRPDGDRWRRVREYEPIRFDSR